MSSEYHVLKHPRDVNDIKAGEIADYGSSDGGSTWYPKKVDSSGRTVSVSGLVPHEYDYIAISYTGVNLTGVVYKTGGSGGSTVATLVLAYTGAVLDSITKT